MTAYPSELTKRFAATLAAMQRRITKLEARTAGIDSGMPLAALPAVVDTTSPLTVVINGVTTGAVPVQTLASYTPTAGDSVLVLPLPQTSGISPGSYVVLGLIT